MPEASNAQNGHESSAPKKRLIICCDGTWQATDRGNITTPSNVARLARMLASTDKEAGNTPQIVYYQGGVGSNGTGTLISDYLPIQEISSLVSGSFAGVLLPEGSLIRFNIVVALFGWGLDENIIQCYHFLSHNYSKGDEIFIFGFSRGAYTARSLSALLTTMVNFRKMFACQYLLTSRRRDSSFLNTCKTSGAPTRYIVSMVWLRLRPEVQVSTKNCQG